MLSIWLGKALYKWSKALQAEATPLSVKFFLEEAKVHVPHHFNRAILHLKVSAKNWPEVVDEFFDHINAPWFNEKTHWCGAFVGSMLSQSYPQFRNLLNHKMSSSQYWLNVFTQTDDPQVGDLVIFTSKKSNFHGHIGFYVTEEDDKILVLGGNQGGAVSYQWFKKDGKVLKFNQYRRVPYDR